MYQLLGTKADGAIVRSVAEKATKFISARQHSVTPLDSIEVYTIGENVRLQVVFQKMLENEATVAPSSVNVNDGKAIREYFKGIFPEFDEERVYVSDMKKMLKWYEILKSNDLLRFEAPQEEVIEEVTAEAAAPAEEAVAEEKPKKAAKKKKAETEEVAEEAEKPAKKKATKKKTEE